MIKLSTKWDYAVKTIIYLLNNWDCLVKISEISIKLKLSESLLRRVVADLERNNIIITIKWRNWWIKIWRDLNKISVYDILFSVWEELWITDCTKWLYCDKHSDCQTTNLYWLIQKSLFWVLKLYTLDKLIKNEGN